MDVIVDERELLEDDDWTKIDMFKKKAKKLLFLKYDYLQQREEIQTYHTWLLILYVLRDCVSNSVSIKEYAQMHILKTKNTYPYKYYRYFMGFPLHGQRTWSNAKSAKKRLNFVKTWEEQLTAKQFKFTCPKVVLQKLTHMEFLNELWLYQWRHEWIYAKHYRLNYDTKFKYKTWKFGLDLAIKNRALTYFKSPYSMNMKKKKKRNKRKVVLPNNMINIGLEVGFAKVFFKKIFHKTIWKKKRVTIL